MISLDAYNSWRSVVETAMKQAEHHLAAVCQAQ